MFASADPEPRPADQHDPALPQAAGLPAQTTPPQRPGFPPAPERSFRFIEDSSSEAPTRVGSARPDISGTRLIEIPGYEILEEIHRGGQGIVYRAVQLGTKREVALKVMLEGPLADEVTRRRFEREVELAASLRHPNIVTILDSGVSQGRYYFAMEYIDGLRLDRYLAQVRPSLRQTLQLFVKICEAVNFAHQRGVIHRDIKPPNILVDWAGEPHVLDFGLAKPLQTADARESTVAVVSVSGQLLGTVAYMSPEQTLGGQNVDVRSDVYSLGVVFYEALLGQLPYSVEGPLGEVLTRIAQAEPQPPRLLRRRSPLGWQVNDEVETILLKALEKTPARRYQTAGDLARDLRHLLAGEPIEAKRASGLYVLRKTLLRYRLQATAAATVLLMLAGVLVFSLFMWTSEREARSRAAQQEELAVNRAIELQQTLVALRRANVRQTIQRGELAQASGDLIAARQFYWDAYQASACPAALWALRHYYAQTGDGGARLLCYEPRGPVALSTDGQLAAVCETPDGITLRRVADGECVAWLRAPGSIGLLSVGDDGSVCAAGRGWVRLWPGHRPGNALAAPLPRGFEALSLHAAAGDAGLLVVGRSGVAWCRASTSEPPPVLPLRGTATACADYSPALGLLAVATTEGVELIRPHESEGLKAQALIPGVAQARLVRWAKDRLIVLDDRAAHLLAAENAGAGEWDEVMPLPTGWDRADLGPDGESLAISLPDGHVQVYRAGRLERSWRVSSQELLDLRLAADGETVITVDRSASITRWLRGQPADVRQLLPRCPSYWAVAEDGSAVLLADARGRTVAYAPGHSDEVEAVSVRRPLRFQVDSATQTLLALSTDAQRVIVCSGDSIRLRDRGDENIYAADWRQPEFTVLRQVCLSGDGTVLACLAQTPAGDRQQISFWRWEPQVRSRRSVELAALLPSAGRSLEFVGSAIRQMQFVPGTHRLLVARSSGELLLLETPDRTGATPVPPQTWAALDSPPTRLALDRRGEQLAVTCEDGLIRVLGLPGGQVRARIRAEHPVSGLSFSAGADTLLVHTADGHARLFELETADRIADWPLASAEGATLATWLGPDELLLGDDAGLRTCSYRRLDRLILESRVYAEQRAVAQPLADYDFSAAWAACTALRADDPRQAAATQVRILESALRRTGTEVPEEWIRAVTAGATSSTLARLGHAAYDGERYALARQWLRAAAEQSGGQVDAYTALRIAQCDYLLGEYAGAAGELAAVATRVDLDRLDRPVAQLLEVAALVMKGDLEQARLRVGQIGTTAAALTPAEIDATTVAQTIARKLTGLEESASTTTLVLQALQGLVGSPVRTFFGPAVEQLVACLLYTSPSPRDS